ncbi:hypothetical protein Nepgr_031653 [Nepenthes gracilis]|uniref:Uncharacterized protein n=1 Tax=Nepenthes gracilis TaxID=150966 RepID=A0AAD3TH48_NEPGR|nr:hypothetical protein Nepgr_031653 [Nepenthes gracilis]
MVARSVWILSGQTQKHSGAPSLTRSAYSISLGSEAFRQSSRTQKHSSTPSLIQPAYSSSQAQKHSSDPSGLGSTQEHHLSLSRLATAPRLRSTPSILPNLEALRNTLAIRELLPDPALRLEAALLPAVSTQPIGIGRLFIQGPVCEVYPPKTYGNPPGLKSTRPIPVELESTTVLYLSHLTNFAPGSRAKHSNCSGTRAREGLICGSNPT